MICGRCWIPIQTVLHVFACARPTSFDRARLEKKRMEYAIGAKRPAGRPREIERTNYSTCPYDCDRCSARAVTSIKRRDGNKCLGCGIKVGLGLHHITPRAEFSKFNATAHVNDAENLMTLCRVCHDYIECHDLKPRTRAGCLELLSDKKLQV